MLPLFPEMFDGFCSTSIIKRAIDKGLVSVEAIQIRDYSIKKHQQVDDTPFGGGSGMVMMAQPVLDALKDHQSHDAKVLLMGPRGRVFNQSMAKKWAQEEELVFICGHYEGIDERIRSYIDEEVSIGDYILTGGELASMVISDAIIRLLEGVIKMESHAYESFEEDLLEHSHYTKPQVYEDMAVPDVLLSGHHENIRKHRLKESLKITYLNRKDLLDKKQLNKEERKLLGEVIGEIENGKD
ncbi:MAG: tRNA (guanosine(37)-N1)-methyltransferase TrmD [Erysipelotrichaceae bacterium]